MGVLLDTHTLLWWFAGDRRLSNTAMDMIGDLGTKRCLSAVSLYEITFKSVLGKLPGVDLNLLEAAMKQQGIMIVPVTRHMARTAGSLPILHRDPFDRMIVATALVRKWKLVSRDRVMSEMGADVVW